MISTFYFGWNFFLSYYPTIEWFRAKRRLMKYIFGIFFVFLNFPLLLSPTQSNPSITNETLRILWQWIRCQADWKTHLTFIRILIWTWIICKASNYIWIRTKLVLLHSIFAFEPNYFQINGKFWMKLHLAKKWVK